MAFLETASVALQLALQFLGFFMLWFWLMGWLPAFDFFSGWTGDATAPALPPTSPRRTVSAPSSAPPLPPTTSFWSCPPFHPAETRQPLAWSQPPAFRSLSEILQNDHAGLWTWYSRRTIESKQKKTVRFAAEAQVETILSRHSVAHPKPVSSAERPPVVEPFDPVACAERLRAFQEAINMPTRSLFLDPKVVSGTTAPVQQAAPVWPPEMLRTEPAPVPADPKPTKPASPQPFAPPCSSSSSSTTPCATEKPQPTPAPAATSAQEPSVAAKTPFRFARPVGPSDPSSRTERQREHRTTLQSALDVLAAVKSDALALGGKADNALSRAWQGYVKRASNRVSLDALDGALRKVKTMGMTDDDRLNEKAIPRGDLEKMLLKGGIFDGLVAGFVKANNLLVYTDEFSNAGGVSRVSRVLIEMQNFFGQY